MNPSNNDQWTTAVQAFIAVIVIGGALGVQLVRGVIPEWLSLSVGAVMGFYFATNRQQVAAIAQRTADIVKGSNGGSH